MSFVYDIADLYKTETSIPAAFEAVSGNSDDSDHRVRILTRRAIVKANLLQRIPKDIAWIFQVPLR